MLVIDDEYLVRMGIRESFDWAKYNVEIVGEASNGKQGLELCNSLRPDIIIMDIRMPLMTGTELIIELNKIGHDCAIIVLSAYKDFDYVKTALENGAFTYLLKPVDNDELIKAVVISLERLAEKRRQLSDLKIIKNEIPAIRNKVFLDLLLVNNDEISKLSSKMVTLGMPVINSGAVVYIRPDNFIELNSSEIAESLEAFCSLARSELEGKFEYILERYSEMVTGVIGCNDIEQLRNIFEKIFEKYNKRLNLTAGISEPFQSMAEISKAYHSAKKISSNRIFFGINSVHTINDKKNFLHKDVIEAMEYIAKNYSKPISVKIVADALYVSESHLMHLFKKNLGKTFNEYLTSYRLMIAKQLLRDGKFKIYEIAEIIGYNDVKYFSLLFKRNEGMTPFDYFQMLFPKNGEE